VPARPTHHVDAGAAPQDLAHIERDGAAVEVGLVFAALRGSSMWMDPVFRASATSSTRFATCSSWWGRLSLNMFM
jgi:hypothetical protein